jgi:hypothetical protein
MQQPTETPPISHVRAQIRAQTSLKKPPLHQLRPLREFIVLFHLTMDLGNIAGTKWT